MQYIDYSYVFIYQLLCCYSFFCNDTAPTEIYTYYHTLSLHDALPIWPLASKALSCRSAPRSISSRTVAVRPCMAAWSNGVKLLHRSEEHTSELQSLMRISYAVFCLKKKNRD